MKNITIFKKGFLTNISSPTKGEVHFAKQYNFFSAITISNWLPLLFYSFSCIINCKKIASITIYNALQPIVVFSLHVQSSVSQTCTFSRPQVYPDALISWSPLFLSFSIFFGCSNYFNSFLSILFPQHSCKFSFLHLYNYKPDGSYTPYISISTAVNLLFILVWRLFDNDGFLLLLIWSTEIEHLPSFVYKN